MTLTSKETIQLLCKKYNFRPSRSSGQNFLISENTLQRIVASANLSDKDTILEIGGGFGTLTNELTAKAGQVITVELDKRLAVVLRKIAAVNKNLTIVEGDIFKKWPEVSSQLKDLQYKLVANLPYNITSLVLRNFLETKPRPSEIVVLVQKEVAERICAEPGEMSLLSVAVQFYGQPEIVALVNREEFWPAPEVDSAILRIQGVARDIRGYQGALGKISIEKLFSLVKIGFSAKRKQLHNNLAAGLRIEDKKAREILANVGIDPATRAQDLAIMEWIKIVNAYEKI
jgi:16S rRNA (adenine1518-N6/adenine1519-N6)-dimethyltransferase